MGRGSIAARQERGISQVVQKKKRSFTSRPYQHDNTEAGGRVGSAWDGGPRRSPSTDHGGEHAGVTRLVEHVTRVKSEVVLALVPQPSLFGRDRRGRMSAAAAVTCVCARVCGSGGGGVCVCVLGVSQRHDNVASVMANIYIYIYMLCGDHYVGR